MSLTYPYLGKPGGMRQLPKPQSYDGPPSRGETVHDLSGGGVGTTRRLATKRSYTLGYDFLPTKDADLLDAFYTGLFDDPVALDFVFVDPTARNVLGADVASCGARSQAGIVWAPTVGTLTRSTTLTSPTAGSGVLAWTGATNGAFLTPGAVTASPTASPVYLASEPMTLSLLIAANTAYQVQVQLVGHDLAGAVVPGALASQTVTIATDFHTAAVGITARTAAFAGCAFVSPRISIPSTGTPPTSLLFAAAQVEYAPSVSSWQPGQGSPRVSITSSIGRAVQLAGFSDHALTLGER